LTSTAPFTLLKKSGSDRPRFIVRVDPQDAFPEIPREYALEQNYPNPFNNGTLIPFSLPLEDQVSLVIYDIRGREVETLIDNRHYGSGHFRIQWQAAGRSSGIYFSRIQIGSRIFTKKMILLR
jgi:hypothetical protein